MFSWLDMLLLSPCKITPAVFFYNLLLNQRNNRITAANAQQSYFEKGNKQLPHHIHLSFLLLQKTCRIHKKQQTRRIKATFISNMKFAIKDSGIIADKSRDFFFKISAYISAIRSTIKAAEAGLGITVLPEKLLPFRKSVPDV